jgi:phosphoserine aminotransferase
MTSAAAPLTTAPGAEAGRIFNFSAGPAVLPLPVLQQVQAELLNYRGAGMSVMEMSHRSPAFEGIIQGAEADLRVLLGIPDGYEILFLQGGATLQFAMLPMNLRPPGASADYILTGAWAQAAFKEAGKLGLARSAGSSEAGNFSLIPAQSDLDLDPQAAYLHFTTNETIHGVQWQAEPVPPPGVPLVADMSSDFVSRPVDISKYGLIYAGAQKNLGPAGVTVVILRKDLLERIPAGLPLMLDYKLQAANKSLYNTPPCFAVYVVGLVLRWLRELGGLEAVARHNLAKAKIVYDAIDSSGGFYRGHAQPGSRSPMNVTFRLPSVELEKLFAKQSEAAGLSGLKGHRSIGGLRASLYNAFPPEGAAALAEFMREFQRTQG